MPRLLRQGMMGGMVWLALLLLPLQVLAADGVIENLRFGVHPDKTRIVLDMSRETDFRAFTLPDPYRVVVDFPQLNWRAERDRGQGVGVVEVFRYGRFDAETTRLVLDTSGPVLIDQAFFIGNHDGTARFVLDLKKTTEAAFRAAGRQQRGSLDPRNRQTQQPLPAVAERPDRQRKLVVLDPGHGGVDPGAVGGNGIYEKDITLSVARRLRDRLKASGRYDVILTRDRDVFIALRDRVRIAREAQADLFISLHADSIRSNTVRGISVYTLDERASDAEAAALAARENRADIIAGIELSQDFDDVAEILIDLTMRETKNQSRRVANTLIEEVRNGNLTTLQNAHRYAGFAVLRAPDVPATLVEMGYLSNPQEARMLISDEHQNRIARSLEAAIDRYFNWLEIAQRY